ncbi:MAG: fructose-1,6-bisphosphatase [Eubacteriales bacterium]|nr:fructose-1,6-bisphosphatase [Eubacteriales bacterium]
MDLKYLELLSKEFPTMEKACCEKINLSAIIKLPKGTEYFFSDLHGEYEAFIDLLRRASGVNRNKIDTLFAGVLTEAERKDLAYTVAYPREVLKKLTLEGREKKEWASLLIYRLVKLLRMVSGKYSRSKLRKSIPEDFRYILDELIAENSYQNRGGYYQEIIKSLVDSNILDEFIIIICRVIRNLNVDKLHILGDIYDRGPRPDYIMDELIHFHDVDIQWGNHDISWMGACAGNRALIANVVRVAMGYNTIDLLEDGYGINLRALTVFANETYGDDPCTVFMPKTLDENRFDDVDEGLAARMGKAMTVIQLKLEGQLIKRHPEWKMDDRLVLEKVNYEDYTIDIDGKTYALNTNNFPTIDPKDPYALSPEEAEVMDIISFSFINSLRLNEHVKFLYARGGVYKVYNGNLLYHGCIPFTEDGEFLALELGERSYKGKALCDYCERKIIDAYYNDKSFNRQDSVDFMWYLWAGPVSPMFGKSKIAMFEQKFIDDKSVRKEVMNPYFELTYKEETCKKIFREFNINPEIGHIINGHVPVKMKDGQQPVRANGRLFVIDGGLAKAYQTRTGMAGYTLIFNSRCITLAEHHVGEVPKVETVEVMKERILVGDTTDGIALRERIDDLNDLIKAYKLGLIKEQKPKIHH